MKECSVVTLSEGGISLIEPQIALKPNQGYNPYPHEERKKFKTFTIKMMVLDFILVNSCGTIFKAYFTVPRTVAYLGFL